MSDPHAVNDTGLHDPRQWLERVGLSERDVPNILAAADLSRRRIAHAREAIASLPAPSIRARRKVRHDKADARPRVLSSRWSASADSSTS